MFTASSHSPASPTSAGVRWVESYFAASRRRYSIVALCNTDQLARVQLLLQKALGSRPTKLLTSQLISTDQHLSRISVEFDADDSERNALSQVVRRLCVMPSVRYVRLDPHPK